MKNTKIYIFLAAALALFALSGCNTIRVDVPASANASGSITINAQQAIWKSNAVDDGRARVDAITTPTTDVSCAGL